MNAFKGAGVALITPFNENLKVDFNALKKIVEHQIDNGTDYLVVQGTTGESATLTDLEKVAVLEYIAEINNNRLPLVLGIGGNNTMAVAEKIASTDLSLVQGVLSVSPYYNKPSQEGIYQHYKTIASETDLPIILYNVPGRTRSNMESDTTLRLANDVKNIVAIKEASGDLEQAMRIIKNRPKDFLVISGEDSLTLPLMSIGADGVISVVANAFPKQFKHMLNAISENNLIEARKLHYSLIEVIDNLFVEGNPAGIKEALKQINLCENYVRLPLTTVTEKTKQNLYKAIANNCLV